MTGNISSGRNFFASASLLERLQDESNSITLSKSQQEIDQLVSGASTQLSDWKGLASMMVGGFGYHLGKTTFVKFVGSSFMKAMAPVVGLATEVTFFEGSKALMNQGPTRLDSSVGPSFMKDWLHSFVNFGILKSFGHLAQHQNVILQHSVQSLGMVAGEHALYQMKMGAKPEGSLLDQLARAEFTNLQLGLSMSLAHHLMGGRLLGIEKGLGLNQQYSSPLNSLYDPIHLHSLSPVGVFQGEAIFSYSKKLGEKGTSHSQDRVLSAKQEKSTRGVKGLPEPLKRVYSDYPELKEAFDQTPWTHEEKIKIVEWIEISEEEAASSFEYLPDYLADFEVNEANKDQVLQHLGMVFTGAVAKESPILGNTFMASEAVNDGGIPLESFIEGYAEMKALGWSQERWFRFINEAVDHHHIDAYPKILDPVKKIMRYQNELGQNTVDLILEKYGEGLADHVSDEVELHEGALLELNLIARHIEGVSKILNKLSVKVDKRQTIQKILQFPEEVLSEKLNTFMRLVRIIENAGLKPEIIFESGLIDKMNEGFVRHLEMPSGSRNILYRLMEKASWDQKVFIAYVQALTDGSEMVFTKTLLKNQEVAQDLIEIIEEELEDKGDCLTAEDLTHFLKLLHDRLKWIDYVESSLKTSPDVMTLKNYRVTILRDKDDKPLYYEMVEREPVNPSHPKGILIPGPFPAETDGIPLSIRDFSYVPAMIRYLERVGSIKAAYRDITQSSLEASLKIDILMDPFDLRDTPENRNTDQQLGKLEQRQDVRTLVEVLQRHGYQMIPE